MDQTVKTATDRPKSALKPKPYIGITKDGVKIVRPKFKPKNFTEAELRAAMTKALSKSA